MTSTLNSVERACADLARDGRAVTGLARSTLYRNATLRTIVEHHQRSTDGPLVPLTDQIATLRAAVNTLADRVRSHEEQLRRLQNLN